MSGININSQGDATIGGDAVGRDKITNVTNIYEAATPTINALHQVPPTPRDFIGRKAELNELMAALEIAFWGFVVCGLSGGYVMSWFPYLLAGLIGAAGRIVTEPTQSPRTNGLRSWSGSIAESAPQHSMSQTDK